MTQPKQSAAERQDQVKQVIDRCIERIAAGETMSDDSLIAAYPKLMPELQRALNNLKMVRQAQNAARGTTTGVGKNTLRIRCPHCHSPTELEEDIVLSHVTCSSCGSHFGLTDETDSAFQVGSDGMVNHFRILERVGTGRFGSVWRAHDTQLDRIVALKLPRKGQLTADEAELFIREARAAAQIRHPNVVRVLEVGRFSDGIYIASELIEGKDLAEWMTEQQVTPREAVELCVILSDSLRHAHEQGIVHRDLKPSNVMLDSGGRPHLLDFGLAKRDIGETTITIDGKLIGTPAYMSPEQARGAAHDADARSDIYAMGVILFELLTGERPFRGSTQMLLQQLLLEDAPRPRQLNSLVPKDVETICLKCLEKDPDTRYQTAADLRNDLQSFLLGEPVKARPISVGNRAWRWCKRRPHLAGLIVTGLSLAVTLGIVAPIVAIKQQRLAESRLEERDNAVRQTYAATMRTVSSAMADGNGKLVRQSLENAPTERRGWEWRHFERRLDGSAHSLELHSAKVNDIAFIPGARAFLSTSADGTVWRVDFDESLSRVVHKTLMRTNKNISTVDIQPNGRVAYASSLEGKTAYRFHAETDDVLNDLTGLEEYYLAHSPDGQFFVSFSGLGSGELFRWHSDDGTTAGSYSVEGAKIYHAIYHPHSQFLAVGLDRGVAHLLDAQNLHLLKKLPALGEAAANRLAFSTSGNQLAIPTSFPSNLIRLWNLQGTESKTLRGHKDQIWGVAFSPDGSRLVSISHDQTGRLWHGKTGELVAVLDGHTAAVFAVRFSPDGSKIYTSSADSTIRVWNGATGESLSTLVGHQGVIYCFELSADGNVLVSGDSEGELRLWDLCADECNVFRQHASFVYDVDVSENGRLAASCSWDRRLRVWDVSTSKVESEWNLPNPHEKHFLVQAIFQPGGQLIAVCSSDTRFPDNPDAIHLVNSTTGMRERRIGIADGLSEFKGTAFNHVGDKIAAGTLSGAVRIWDPDTGRLINEWQLAGTPIQAVVFDETDTHLYTGDKEGAICRLDVNGHDIQPVGQHNAPVVAIATSPDNRLFASSSSSGDEPVRIWQLAEFKQLATLDHGMAVYDLVFHPDGSRLATAGSDGVIRIWDTQSWTEVAQLIGHTDYVHGLAFAPDGSRLFSASGDYTVRIWEGSDGEQDARLGIANRNAHR